MAGAEKGRRVQLPTKTWMCKVQWGYTSPSLFNSRTSGQHLVRAFLLEIILSRGMRSHCRTCRLWKQVWALGTGAEHLHFSWPERKLVSHFIQNKPVRPNLGHCGRQCCTYTRCSLLSSMVFLTQDGIFWALPDIYCKNALYKRNSLKSSPTPLALHSAGCSPAFVSLYSAHIQLFQLNRGWSLFPSCSPILAAQSSKESSWPIRHLIPVQSHSRVLTFQHKNIVWTKNKGIFLGPIFSKLWSKRHWAWGTKCLLLNSPTCSPLPKVQQKKKKQSYSQEEREAHSGGRLNTASRIHLPLMNKRSLN